MKQRTFSNGFHVALIMDGNGRWARARGLPRLAGHRAGAAAVRRTVEAAPDLGIRILTLYAFSSDNWGRSRAEVQGLMRLLVRHLRQEAVSCAKNGVRIQLVGRRDRLPSAVVNAAERAEKLTADGDALWLRIAVDYSSRDAILRAARRLDPSAGASRDDFACALGSGRSPVPDVDLVIRTGGEQRLSDFLLWESAYAELVFLEGTWPDFAAMDLESAVRQFRGRERRFGRVPGAAVG
jgi:undecaprenyl diphosphate synthase